MATANNIFTQLGMPSLAGTPLPDPTRLYDPQKAANIFSPSNTFSKEPVEVNPKRREEQSKKQLSDLVEIQRRAADASWNRSRYANAAMGSLASKVGLKPSPFVIYDVPDSAVYNKLTDGRLIPKYKNYVHGVDNDDRLGKMQSTGEKWGNGILKFFGKTALNTATGIANAFYAIPHAIAEGNFHAMYDNSLMDWMEDWNVQMDSNLPNYMTKAERELNFFQKMGTANFWANDFLGGLSFTAGALGTEAFFAALTGGTSLVTAGARMAMRGVTKAGLRTAAKATAGATGAAARGYLTNAKSAMDGYLRATGAMKTTNTALSVLNNARFIYTSAGWEASVEAYHYLKTARQNFYESFERYNGRKPNAEEERAFADQALSVGNSIWAANLGIVGASNMLMFGSYFGMGVNTSGKITRAIDKKLFGIGAVKGVDGTYTVIKPTAKQKAARITYNTFEKAFVEGVWEEGTQGVASHAGEEYVRSRFDPYALEKNIDLNASLKKGFHHAYATTEGFTEVGIGMIIGGLFGIGNFRQSAAKRANIAAGVEMANKTNADLTLNSYMEYLAKTQGAGMNISDQQFDLLRRLEHLNLQQAYVDKADEEAKNGNNAKSSDYMSLAVFEQLAAHDMFGELDNAQANFNHIIDNSKLAEIQATYGVDEEGAKKYIEAIKEDYAAKMESYKRGKEFADLVIGDDIRYKTANMVLARNVYLGEQAQQSMQDLAESISKLTGEGGVIDAMKIYSSVEKDDNAIINAIVGLDELIEKASTEVNRLNLEAQSATREDKIDKNKAALANAQKALNSLSTKQTALRNNLQAKIGYVSQSTLDPFTKDGQSQSVVTLDQLLQANREIHKLDNLYKVLAGIDKPKADALASLMQEYSNQLLNFRAFNENIRRMSDKQYMRNTQRGITKLLQGFSEQYSQGEDDFGFSELGLIETPVEIGKTFRKQRIKDYDEKLEKAYKDGQINEDELYTFKAFNHMIERYAGKYYIEGETELVETVKGEVSDILSGVDGEVIKTGEQLRDYIAKAEAAPQTETPDGQIVSPGPSGLYDSVMDVLNTIAQKNQLKIRLTNQENSIYDRLKNIVNNIQENLPTTQGDTVTKKILQLQDRLDATKRTKNHADREKLAIDNFAKDNGLEVEVKHYERLAKKSLTEELTEAETEQMDILGEELAETGEQNGFPEITHIIRDVVRIENHKGKPSDTTNTDTTEDVVTDASSLEVLDKNGVPVPFEKANGNYNVMQNTVTVQAQRQTEHVGDIVQTSWIVSNISAEKLLEIIGVKDFIKNKYRRNNRTFTAYHFNLGSKDLVFVRQDYYRNRLQITDEVMNIIKDEAGIIIAPFEKQSTAWTTIYKRVTDGESISYIPLDSESGYGLNGTERINQEALSKIKPGDPIDIEVDISDAYNQKLISDYHKALQTEDIEKINAAREALNNGIVLKCVNKDNFVSVFPSVNDLDDIQGLDQATLDELNHIRSLAVSQLFSENGRIEGEGSVHLRDEMDEPLRFGVRVAYVGKPKFTVDEIDGQPTVRRFGFDEFSEDKGLAKVKNIGYILDSVPYFKDENHIPVNEHTFCSRIIRSGKAEKGKYRGIKVPVVVIEADNGNGYLYPVNLKEREVDDYNEVLLALDRIINAEEVISPEDVQLVNDFLTDNDVDRNEYSVPYGATEDMNVDLERIRKKVVDILSLPNVSGWISDTRSRNDILKADAIININLDGQVFFSPKIRLDYGEVASATQTSNIGEQKTPVLDEQKKAMYEEIKRKAKTGESLTAEETAFVDEMKDSLNEELASTPRTQQILVSEEAAKDGGVKKRNTITMTIDPYGVYESVQTYTHDVAHSIGGMIKRNNDGIVEYRDVQTDGIEKLFRIRFIPTAVNELNTIRNTKTVKELHALSYLYDSHPEAYEQQEFDLLNKGQRISPTDFSHEELMDFPKIVSEKSENAIEIAEAYVEEREGNIDRVSVSPRETLIGNYLTNNRIRLPKAKAGGELDFREFLKHKPSAGFYFSKDEGQTIDQIAQTLSTEFNTSDQEDNAITPDEIGEFIRKYPHPKSFGKYTREAQGEVSKALQDEFLKQTGVKLTDEYAKTIKRDYAPRVELLELQSSDIIEQILGRTYQVHVSDLLSSDTVELSPTDNQAGVNVNDGGQVTATVEAKPQNPLVVQNEKELEEKVDELSGDERMLAAVVERFENLQELTDEEWDYYRNHIQEVRRAMNNSEDLISIPQDLEGKVTLGLVHPVSFNGRPSTVQDIFVGNNYVGNILVAPDGFLSANNFKRFNLRIGEAVRINKDSDIDVIEKAIGTEVVDLDYGWTAMFNNLNDMVEARKKLDDLAQRGQLVPASGVFKPISKKALKKLIRWLLKTGLAKSVVTDPVEFKRVFKEVLARYAKMRELTGISEDELAEFMWGAVATSETNNTIEAYAEALRLIAQTEDSISAAERISKTNDAIKAYAEALKLVNRTEGTAGTEETSDIIKAYTEALKLITQAKGTISTAEKIKANQRVAAMAAKMFNTISLRALDGSIEALKLLDRLKSTPLYAKLSRSAEAVVKAEDLINYGDDMVKLILNTFGVDFMANPQGVAYGFTTNGIVYLNTDYMNANTPVHEFAHLWLKYIEITNPALWNKAVELIRGTTYWSNVLNDPLYADIQNDPRRIAHEALASAMGDKGASILYDGETPLVERATLFEELKKILSEIWEAIAGSVNIRNLSGEQISKLTLEQFLTGATADVLSGEQIVGETQADTSNNVNNDTNSTANTNFAPDNGNNNSKTNENEQSNSRTISGEPGSRSTESSTSEPIRGRGLSTADAGGISQSERRGRTSGSTESGTRSESPGSGNAQTKKKKYTNEEITALVSSVTTVAEDGRVAITGEVTEEVKEAANQYKSGGVVKEGRGILDEYYTNSRIVEAVRGLLTQYFKPDADIRVLEPSVGTGNFLYASPSVNARVTGFEINDTTARIAKIFHPNAEINLRSFETEFIDEAGRKKPLPEAYQLIMGNPPYGEHRGKYKGLGEESGIAKYEDYFVKRSLDILEEDGILAMVLPSSWMNRHPIPNGYIIENAFRLPNGMFKGTDVGTDIVVLRKKGKHVDIGAKPFFETHPLNVLGEKTKKNNRYGREEDYVEGDIDSALGRLSQHLNVKEAAEILDETGLEQTSDNVSSVEAKISETGDKESAKKLVEEELQGAKEAEEQQTKEEAEKAKEEAAQKAKIDKKTADNTTHVKAKAPVIVSGRIKYEFSKEDKVIPASQQFGGELSQEELDAFRDISLTGELRNHEQHIKYANFINGKWVHDFYYAEGDIYTKLTQLKTDFEAGHIDQTQYDKQHKLLQSVLPTPRTLDKINISPNVKFVKDLSMGDTAASRTLYDMFIAFLQTLPREAFADSSPWEVKHYADNERVTGRDKERNQLIRERRKRVGDDLFKKFLTDELTESQRRLVAQAYNRLFNAVHNPDYSKVPMFSQINESFKGSPLKLTSVQKGGVGRLSVKGVGVLAHEVGFGKTLSGVLTMHEAMTKGHAKRPLIVAPNRSVLNQWVETIFESLPNAKINVLDNLGVKYDLTGFQVEDGEITLVTFEGFKAMGFKDSTYNRLSGRYTYITDQIKDRQSQREHEIRRAKKAEKEGRMRKGAIYNFEDFGFDYLTFDEVHRANHIVEKVKLEKGEDSEFKHQQQTASDLGIKTWLASQYIQDKYNGRNVVLLSATPFTNNPLEYYSILSLVANKTLERLGFFEVAQFFETFMLPETESEINAKGQPEQKKSIRRFKNHSQFQRLLSEFIDIKGEEDNPDLVRPQRNNREYKVVQNDLTRNMMARVQKLLDDDEQMLTGLTHARMIAFSPYATSLYRGDPPSYKEFVEGSPKIDAMMKLIAQNKADRPEAGQLIYSEIGISFFPHMKEYLVKEVGYAANEIGIIAGGDHPTSQNERSRIQEEFNKGNIKIVIGSPAIKEGINLQANTSDMYILSLPYNFTTLRQIEGRSWRQGNRWKNIRINYMLTNDSIDVFVLQRLQRKQSLYNEAMRAGLDDVDVGDISAAELKENLITDPEVRAMVEVDKKILGVRRDIMKIKADLSFVQRKRDKHDELEKNVKQIEENIEMYKGDIAQDPFDPWYPEYLKKAESSLVTAKKKLEEEKQKMEKNGVRVGDMENQTAEAEMKIKSLEEMEKALKDSLPDRIAQYKAEDEAKEEIQTGQYVAERKQENGQDFYILREDEKKANNTDDEPMFQFGRVNELSEMEAIKEAAIADGTFMKAPNGKDTKLTERQWLQVRTKAFKEWFGDWINDPENASKVVDENGEPMVVYHGTKNVRGLIDATFKEWVTIPDFDVFDTQGKIERGAWFSPNLGLAKKYGNSPSAFFLNIRNPVNSPNRVSDTADEHDGAYRMHGKGDSISKAWEIVAFSPNQIKSATANNGNFDANNPDIRFQFIGEKGVSNLTAPEEPNVWQEALEIAKEMESSGKDAKTIKLATAWERGADGEWRYEIPDIEVTSDLLDFLEKAKNDPTLTIKLSDAVEDMGGLFAAYPQLLDVNIVLVDSEGSGHWDQTRKQIAFANSIDHLADGLPWVRNVIVHELQHAIQYIEGFATGVSPSALITVNQKTEKVGQDRYMRSMGETEARNAESRMDMTLEERRASLASETEDVTRKNQMYYKDDYDYDAWRQYYMENNLPLQAASIRPVKRTSLIRFINWLKKNNLTKDVDLPSDEKTFYGNLAKTLMQDREKFNSLPAAVRMQVIYYARQATNIQADIERGWSSWSFGGEGFRGTREELEAAIEEEGTKYEEEDLALLDAAKNNDWEDYYTDYYQSNRYTAKDWSELSDGERYEFIEDQRGRIQYLKEDTPTGSFYISGFDMPYPQVKKAYEDGLIRELAPGYWVLVDDRFDNGEIAGSELEAETLEEAIREAEEDKRGLYSGDGTQIPVWGENAAQLLWSSADNLRHVFGLQLMATRDLNVYGYVTPDGVIHLNPAKMNANTPVHEFAHLWVDFIKKNNRELWQKGKSLIMSSKYWDAVNNNPAYKNLTEDQKVDEALAMAIGDRGEAVFHSTDNLKTSRLMAWLNEVWEWIGSVFGIRGLTAAQIERLSLDQFIEGAVADLLAGDAIENLSNIPSYYDSVYLRDSGKLYILDKSKIRIVAPRGKPDVSDLFTDEIDEIVTAELNRPC